MISIIIPVFNGGKTLKRCIDSILNSTTKNYEIIIVDDGSTDNSWSIIEEYSRSNFCVKGIKQSNKGISVARNVGIKLAQGEYLTFVDCDDFVEKDLYGKLGNILDLHDPDLLCYGYFYMTASGDSFPETQNKVERDVLYDRQYLEEYIIPGLININNKTDWFIGNYVWNKVYKTVIVRSKNCYFNEQRKMWEDRLFTVSFCRYANTIYYSSIYGYYYVNNSNSSSMRLDESIFDIILENKMLYEEFYRSIYSFSQIEAADYYCRVVINTTINMFLHWEKQSDKIRGILQKLCENNEILQLFLLWDSNNDFEKKFKKALLAKNDRYLAKLCYTEWRCKDKIRLLNRVRQKCRNIVRRDRNA